MMTTATNNENNIPFYIVFDDDDYDDIDSVISFNTSNTGPSAAAAELLDNSETRWDHASLTRNRASQPHHPRRSISHDSTANKIKIFQQAYTKEEDTSGSDSSQQLSEQAAAPPTSSPNVHRHGISPRSSPGKRLTNTTPTKKLSPNALQNRTNRLTRMADRAKAVARTPVARRNSGSKTSLQRQLQACQRRSLPPHMPLRTHSSSWSSPHPTSSSSPCCSPTPLRTTAVTPSPIDEEQQPQQQQQSSFLLDCSYAGSGSGSTMSGLSSSISSHQSFVRPRMIPRSKSMAAAIAARRRNSIATSAPYPVSYSETLLARRQHQLVKRGQALAQLAAAGAVVMGRRPSTPGCFHMSQDHHHHHDPATVHLNLNNRPPRLPQRYPSEVMVVGS